MTHEEELRLAARLQVLRRDLLALALLDPASSAELTRVAADVTRGALRIEAVVDAPELGPDEARRQLDAFRAGVAQLLAQHPAQRGSAPAAGDTSSPEGPSEERDPALRASLELAGSIRLQWACVDRLLRASWVGAAARAAAPASSSPPDGFAERARRARGEIDAIIERFVASHQGLVANVARRYRALGLSQDDLMQDGNIGLLRALEKFDVRRGKPFAAYAVWWVRESIRRALAQQARTIRLPAHAIAKRHAIGKASRQLAHELGHDPSSQELSHAIGLAPESIDDVLRLSKEPLSLDAPRADDTEMTLGDSIADRRIGNPNEQVSTRQSVDHLQLLLGGLTPRERHVLDLRFGLDGGEERTLEEIGHSLGLTRERARQIVAGALDKLQRASRARRLGL